MLMVFVPNDFCLPHKQGVEGEAMGLISYTRAGCTYPKIN
jgi:hypothetical protein